jgi:anaphase-promoting complex subunit 3
MKLAMLVFAALLALAPAALGATPEQLFTDGQTLYDDGKYDQAIAKFQKALAASGSPNARLYIARSLAKLGRLAEAYREMKTTVTDSTRMADTEPRYAGTRDAAAAELARLEPKIAKVIIAVADESLAVEVTLSGVPVDKADLGQPVAVMPGEVVVRARAPGKKPVERRQKIAAGDTRTITVVLEDETGPPVGEPLPEPEPEPASGGGGDIGAVRAAGIAVGILGVAGLVTFAATGAMAKDRFDQVSDECGGVRCADPSYEDVIDEGKNLELVADVMAGVGGGLLAAGVLMIIFGGPADDATEARLHPLVEPGGGGVRVRF